MKDLELNLNGVPFLLLFTTGDTCIEEALRFIGRQASQKSTDLL
jgi:hypothetical protein